MTTATQVFEGTYESDPVHSKYVFEVTHNEISTYTGTLDDVSAKLTEAEGEVALEGAAKVESISIREPEEFRAHVLGADFFDAESHPEVGFRSTDVELHEDGSARVEGELTIKGITKPVVATGSYEEPRDGLGGKRAAFELETSFDRRDYGFDWQMELPSGGNALGWDVGLRIHLELVQPEA